MKKSCQALDFLLFVPEAESYCFLFIMVQQLFHHEVCVVLDCRYTLMLCKRLAFPVVAEPVWRVIRAVFLLLNDE